MIPETRANQPAVIQVPKRAITVYLTREVMSVVGLAVILFWPAGRVDWGMGWALVGLWAAWEAGMAWVVIRRHPGMLLERLGAKKGSQRWDAILVPALSLLQAARCIVGGFDQRYGWTGSFLPSTQAAFLIAGILGAALFIWAAAANPFFSQVVRIQGERGHTVAQGGPYRFVRHPGYAATLLMEIAAPLILGSWWALIPSGLLVIVLIVRTALEDRTLQQELPGYPEYAQQVKYRLIPGLW